MISQSRLNTIVFLASDDLNDVTQFHTEIHRKVTK